MTMFSTRLKELRLSKGITQVELAKSLGVTKQCVSNWENDNIQPSIDTLKYPAILISISIEG